MKYITFLYILIVYSSFANGQIVDPQVYLDNKYNHEIDWTKSIETGGALIYDHRKPNGDKYTLEQRRYKNLTMLVFNKIVGEPYDLEMLDILVIPLKNSEFLSHQTCQLNNETDQEIVALVVLEDKEFYDNILMAWRANRKTRKFEEISISGIICMNEGYGL